jgi:hypothetical protein
LAITAIFAIGIGGKKNFLKTTRKLFRKPGVMTPKTRKLFPNGLKKKLMNTVISPNRTFPH